MAKKILKRIFSSIISIMLASLLVFSMVRLSPIDPIELMYRQPGGNPVNLEYRQAHEDKAREDLGLNDPIIVQYIDWLGSALKGDLGTSFATREPIRVGIGRTLRPTIMLALASVALELVFAMILAIISIIHAERFVDHLIQSLTIVLRSIPFFVLAFFFLQLFSVRFKIFSITNRASLERLWLPALVIGLSQCPRLTRIIRTEMVSQLEKTYVLDMISKGYSKKHIIKETLRNSFGPIWTALSLSLAGSIGGLVVSENLFTWPGLGNYGMTAALKLDYPAVQAYLLVVILMVVLINFLSDIIYSLVLRLERV